MAVPVENRPGATTVIGTEYVARQPADGHTLLSTFTFRSSSAGAPAERAPWDPQRDFVPIVQFIRSEVADGAQMRRKALPDFIAAARTAMRPARR